MKFPTSILVCVLMLVALLVLVSPLAVAADPVDDIVKASAK